MALAEGAPAVIDPELLMHARNVPHGSLIQQTAFQVCALRLKDPYMIEPHPFAQGLMNWQLIVAEFMLFHQALPGMVR
jgi:hypothetical protein